MFLRSPRLKLGEFMFGDAKRLLQHYRELNRPNRGACQYSNSKHNSAMRYVMEKVPGRDLWAVIDSVTHRPALVNDVPQIDLELDDADDLTDLLNRLYREASVSAKH